MPTFSASQQGRRPLRAPFATTTYFRKPKCIGAIPGQGYWCEFENEGEDPSFSEVTGWLVFDDGTMEPASACAGGECSSELDDDLGPANLVAVHSPSMMRKRVATLTREKRIELGITLPGDQ